MFCRVEGERYDFGVLGNVLRSIGGKIWLLSVRQCSAEWCTAFPALLHFSIVWPGPALLPCWQDGGQATTTTTCLSRTHRYSRVVGNQPTGPQPAAPPMEPPSRSEQRPPPQASSPPPAPPTSRLIWNILRPACSTAAGDYPGYPRH